MLGTCACPLLEVRPSRGLVDEKFQIAVENLPPAHKVTLHSAHQSEDGDFWEAFGFYVSDTDGRVMGQNFLFTVNCYPFTFQHVITPEIFH